MHEVKRLRSNCVWETFPRHKERRDLKKENQKAGYTDQNIKNNKRLRKPKIVKILLDSGASASIIHKSFVKEIDFSTDEPKRKWFTMDRTFTTA